MSCTLDRRMAEPESEMPEHARHGLETVAAIHARAQQSASAHHVLIERVTLQVGTPRTVYVITALTAAWISWNTVAHHFNWIAPDPPPFSFLQGIVTVGALVLTTMVLVTQNRHARISESRSQLDLQMSLLAEQKVAKLIQLVEELRVDLPNVRNREDLVAQDMQRAVDPGQVAAAIEETLGEGAAKSGGSSH